MKDELKEIAISEMKHAEAIAEKLAYLGGTPTTKPDPVFVGENPNEMLERDKQDEERAIELYGRIIAKALEEGDHTTRKLFEKIFRDEEEDHDTFSGLLEGV